MRSTLSRADRCDWQLAALRVKLKLHYLQNAVKAGFDPNQPRVPAGHTGGGQWTSTGRGGLSTQEDFDAGSTDDYSSVAGEEFELAVLQGPEQFIIKLIDEEKKPNQNGGHTIEDHVAKTDQELLNRLDENRWIESTGAFTEKYYFENAVGSFRNIEEANELVNIVLQNNKELINRFLRGEFGPMPKAIQMKFDKITGKEAYRPYFEADAFIRQTHSVRVVIRHDPGRKRGYNILSAFPTNGTPKGRAVIPIRKKSMADYLEFPDDFISFIVVLNIEMSQRAKEEELSDTISRVAEEYKNSETFIDFVDFILRQEFPDEILEEIWANSGATWRLSPGMHREVFAYVRDQLSEGQNGPD